MTDNAYATGMINCNTLAKILRDEANNYEKIEPVTVFGKPSENQAAEQLEQLINQKIGETLIRIAKKIDRPS
jgi:hypothetical protein